MKQSEIVNRYVQAIATSRWDYPKGSKFKNKAELVQAVKHGGTVEDLAMTIITSCGSITGALLCTQFGHTSQGTRRALNKGIKEVLTWS